MFVMDLFQDVTRNFARNNTTNNNIKWPSEADKSSKFYHFPFIKEVYHDMNIVKRASIMLILNLNCS